MPIKINEIEFIEEALIGRMPPIVKVILETPPLFQFTDNSCGRNSIGRAP